MSFLDSRANFVGRQFQFPVILPKDKDDYRKGEFRVFLGNARGSLSELETQVLIARNLDFISEIEADRLLEMAKEVGRTLNGLIASTKK